MQLFNRNGCRSQPSFVLPFMQVNMGNHRERELSLASGSFHIGQNFSLGLLNL